MAIPERREDLLAMGYVFDNEAHCRGCGAEIEWWVTPKGKKIPMSVKEVRDEQKSTFAPVEKFVQCSALDRLPQRQRFQERKIRMTKGKTQPEKQHLPDKKNAPKKTGKKGIGPLNVETDFETPVKVDRKTMATEPEQKASLLVEQPKRPTVVDGRFEAFFLKPTFSKTKDGKKLVGLRFTVPLEDEHDGLLPKIVHEGYKDVKKKGRNKIGFNGVPGQCVDIYLSQDIAEEALTLPAAKFVNSRIDIIERKGEGAVRKVIRLSFTLQVEQSHEVRNFATENHGANFWLTMEETEEMLWDEEEEG